MRVHTVPLHIGDLLGGVSHMDGAELGAYMFLLLACYQASDHRLPLQDERLARIARTSTRTWKRIRPVVMQKFKQDDTGYWHERVMKEVDKIQRLTTKNRANALKKGKSDKPVGKPKRSEASKNKPSQSVSETEANQKPETKSQKSETKKKVTLEELSVEHIASWLARQRSEGRFVNHDEYYVLERFKDFCKSKGKRYVDYPAALRNAFTWDSVKPERQARSHPQSAHDTFGRAWAKTAGVDTE